MKLTGFYRSTKYLHLDNLRLMPELLGKMVRNTITFHLRDADLTQHHTDRLEDFHHLVQEFCETSNQAMWSHDNRSWYHTHDYGIVDDKKAEEDDVQGYSLSIKLFFESTDDADRFVKNFLVLYRLSN
jgi:hypothetical protein